MSGIHFFQSAVNSYNPPAAGPSRPAIIEDGLSYWLDPLFDWNSGTPTDYVSSEAGTVNGSLTIEAETGAIIGWDGANESSTTTWIDFTNVITDLAAVGSAGYEFTQTYWLYVPDLRANSPAWITIDHKQTSDPYNHALILRNEYGDRTEFLLSLPPTGEPNLQVPIGSEGAYNGKWFAFAVTKTAGGGFKIWRRGATDSSWTTATSGDAALSRPYAAGNPYRIGKTINGTRSDRYTLPVGAKVGPIKWYNVELNETQLNTNFDAEKARFEL
jgi:hypothetical protein